jgi:hypothetical protein
MLNITAGTNNAGGSARFHTATSSTSPSKLFAEL